MTARLKAKFLLCASISFISACATAARADQTSTGIPIDTSWKKLEYEYAKKNVVHPAWGIAHSERDYQVAKKIAEEEHITLDLDVLFAAAFLHDLGGIGAFAKPGVDHAVRSAELAEPLLQKWGFPMRKWPQVKEMILGHTYYGPLPASPQAFAFRDADVVDFLGAIGAARILSVTEEPGQGNGALATTAGVLTEFSASMAGKCTLNTCKDIADKRTKELKSLLETLNEEALNGAAL